MFWSACRIRAVHRCNKANVLAAINTGNRVRTTHALLGHRAPVGCVERAERVRGVVECGGHVEVFAHVRSEAGRERASAQYLAVTSRRLLMARSVLWRAAMDAG